MSVPPNNNLSQWNYRLTLGLFVIQTLALVGLAYIVLVGNQPTITPVLFMAYVPQKILTPRVTLADGVVKVEATKCNLTDDDLAVGGTLYWVREEPSFKRILYDEIPMDRAVSFRAGCVEQIFENVMPDGITLGKWHLEGANIVETPTGKRQTVGWHTESFEIVPSKSDAP